MRKNAFTLAELLAVIAILSIVFLITMPTIFNVINDSKKNTFTRSVEEVQNVAILDYNEYARGGEVIYKYEEGKFLCMGCDAGSDLELDFSGDIEDGSGSLTVFNGEVLNLSFENAQFKASLKDGKVETLKKE